MRALIILSNYVILSQKRFYTKQVRVRFAPSPTGNLHIGGLRTALYNYLFARANNGTFILRIEDTDQTRVLPETIEKLQNDLFWLGIISDENPTRGGPYGPYVQSKRLDLYKENVLKLLSNKTAYYCFCSKRRLELLKRDAIKCGQIPKYDNKCRDLSSEEVEDRLSREEEHCIRFKLTPDSEPFDDMVYGETFHDIFQTEGDPVIVKNDGYPTYHFANVVDDHYMEISHVLRGIEWQISTPKHLMLYKAFGWAPPIFGHLPLILNSDGSKVSKRQGGVKIDTLREEGFFPLALINYVIHAGGGFARQQGLQYLYSYEELIKQFHIKKINVHSSKLSPEKLLEFNKLQISRLLNNEENNIFLVERMKKLVQEAFPNCKTDGSLILDEQHVITILKWAQNRIFTLSDLVTPKLAFLWILPPPPIITEPECLNAIKVLNAKLAGTDLDNFKRDRLLPYLREFANTSGVPFPTLMKTLRVILCGLETGPSVAEIIEILGKDNTLSRLRRCFH